MNKFVSFLSWVLTGWFFKLFIVKDISGKENFSKKKNYIMVFNHVSHLDWLIGCYLCVPRKYTFMGQVDKIKGFAGFLRDIMYGIGETIRVDRNDPDSKKKATQKAVEFLRKGYNLCMFPEGRRSRDGKLQTFLRGMGKIYLETGTPILPVAISGTYEMMPPGGKAKLNRSAKVAIGNPIEFQKDFQEAKNMNRASGEYLLLCEKIAKVAEDQVRAMLAQNQMINDKL